MATFDSQSCNGRYIRLTVTESDVDSINNKSKVNWNVTVYGANGTWYSSTVYLAINGTELVNTSWIDPPQGSFPMVNGTSKSGSFWVSHGSDGKKSVSVTFNVAIYYRSAESHGGTFDLTNIDRSAPTITQDNISGIDVNSFVIGATSNVDCNKWEYSLNNGSTWKEFSSTDGMSASGTITDLAMNTDYTVLIRAARTSNGVYGISGSKTAKTLGSSTITTLTDVIIGSETSVTWTPLDATFKYKLTFSCGSWSHTTGYITPNRLTAYTYGYVVPMSVCDELPNTEQGTLTVSLITYTADNVQVGAANSKTSILAVPSFVVPSVDSVTLTEGTASGFTSFVKSLSTVRAAVTASGVYSSSVIGIDVKIGNNSYQANSSGVAVSDILQTSGTITVLTTVMDSRGRTATDSRTITVYDYFQPIIGMNLAINTATNVVTTTVTGSIAPVNDLNGKSLVIRRKRLSDDSVTVYTANPLPAYNYAVTWTQTVSDIGTESYEYTAIVTDTKQSVSIIQQTAIICLSRLAGGRGVTLFQEAEHEGFWIRDIQHDITAAEYLELASELALLYDPTADYYVGEFCLNNGSVWECNTAITGGESWNANHWTEISA